MLAGLAIGRVRRLLEDAVGTLEQDVPPTDTPLDAVLRPVRGYRQVPSGACPAEHVPALFDQPA
jgi:hypothetical protein